MSLDKSILKADEMILNMGPQHPSTHGVLRLKIITDGEIVNKVEPIIGYLHRCFEKHCENLPYEQIVPFTDRCDYLASMHMDHAYSIAVEKLLDIELPERVEYIRVIIAELQRIASHLVAIGTFGLDVGAITPFTWTIRDRERVLDLFEALCGARLLYNYIWPGGLAHDLPPNFINNATDFLDYFEPQIVEYNNLLTTNKIFIERSADVGVMPKEVAINYGVSGPTLRASGVDYDLRKTNPYSIYDKFDFNVPVGKGEMGSVVTTLKGRAKIKRTMWSRRAQDYQEKLNSGDPVRIAEVLRDLHRAADQPEQSYSERQLYEAALDRLAREFAAVEKIDQDTAEERIENFLLRAA